MALKAANLSAGQFYGVVPRKRVVSSAILSEVVHENAVEVPTHAHELAYFSLVLGGAYSEDFGSVTSVHRPMSVLWHRDSISHKDRIGNAGARFFMVEIGHSGIDQLRQYSQIPLDFSQHRTPLVWLAARLFHEFKNWDEGSGMIAEGLVLEMLGHSARTLERVEKRRPKWMSMLIDKMEAEFPAGVSTEELAKCSGVHPVHLAAAFRKFNGQTIGEYLHQLRISCASELLIEGDKSLADIAFESGFSDQSHLNRIFKRYTGISPGSFRKALN